MSVRVGVPSPLLHGFWDELYLLSHLAGSPHKILTGTWDETGGYFEGQKSKMREEARTTDADILYIQNSACDATHIPKLHVNSSTATNL